MEVKRHALQYYFGVKLGQPFFRHCDYLSRTLQHKHWSAAESQSVVITLTVTTLQSVYNDKTFELFWEKVQKECEKREVKEPELPRARKVPKGFEIGLTVLRLCIVLLTLKYATQYKATLVPFLLLVTLVGQTYL